MSTVEPAHTRDGTARGSVLDVSGLCAHAGGADRPLLDGVALNVGAGEVTAVVGPSGSGKTTLGLAALGAARDTVRLTGRVLLGGTDLLLLAPDRRPAARASLAAHLPQHPERVLDPIRRVGGALTETAALGHPARAARKPAAREALARAGLEWDVVRRRFPHQLSGGQQQRLALASALVTGARLLVLDEPTSGLDPALARELGRTVRTLADDGAAVLLLSHDFPLVRATADRVLVLERGRTVEDGPVAEVLGGTVSEDPAGRHPATRELRAAERRTGTGPGDGAAHEDPDSPGTGAARTPTARTSTARTSTAPMVAAEGISVRRRSGTPLAGPVTLEFPPGSRTALLGPSGSGKTTFARALAGLTAPTRGDVRLGGRPLPARVDRRTAAQRRAVQYVHQSSADSFEGHRPLLPQLADTARLLRGLSGEEARAEALTAAGALGLDEALLHRTPDRLSGGQLQRCALVRALTARPVLLVCDEVTSALDTVSRRRLHDALPGMLAPAGTALLLVSHDLTAVRVLTTRAAYFEEGRCVRQGPTDEVLTATWPLPRATGPGQDQA